MIAQQGVEGIGEVSIRPVATVDEYHECERIQRQAWDFDSELDVVPLTQMLAAHDAGGLVLGAFDGTGGLRGFCYGFLGRDREGRLIHHSHMTAVEPELRSSGLGARLKWAQREAVLADGIEIIEWTFDPLESLNAYFNFSKLGVRADVYEQDLYGQTGSPLHQGMPTDRFLVQWSLRSERVRARRRGRRGAVAEEVAAAPENLSFALRGILEEDGHLRPAPPDLSLAAARILCEIPPDIQRLKRADMAAAHAWRMASREVLTHYLDSGWSVTECVRTREAEPRTLYLLSRDDSED